MNIDFINPIQQGNYQINSAKQSKTIFQIHNDLFAETMHYHHTFRFGTQCFDQSKANKPSITSDESLDQPNQDNALNTANLATCHKLSNPKKGKALAPKIKIDSRRIQSPHYSFVQQRAHIFNLYSKMHYCFKLSAQSLFLAIDIFDKFISKQTEELSPIQIMQASQACFMMAIKYEEVYPPTLQQIQEKMKLRIGFDNYVDIQFKVLQALNFNLNLGSPVSYFPQFPCQMTEERKSFVYLNLEVACINYHIKKQYGWKVIAEAVKILFKSIPESLGNQVATEVDQCLKMIIIERCKLDSCYAWLNKKYSSAKYHQMALKPLFMDQNM